MNYLPSLRAPGIAKPVLPSKSSLTIREPLKKRCPEGTKSGTRRYYNVCFVTVGGFTVNKFKELSAEPSISANYQAKVCTYVFWVNAGSLRQGD